MNNKLFVKTQIKRLEWYKNNGWTKSQLIKEKVFPKIFIEKYYNKK